MVFRHVCITSWFEYIEMIWMLIKSTWFESLPIDFLTFWGRSIQWFATKTQENAASVSRERQTKPQFFHHFVWSFWSYKTFVNICFSILKRSGLLTFVFPSKQGWYEDFTLFLVGSTTNQSFCFRFCFPHFARPEVLHQQQELPAHKKKPRRAEVGLVDGEIHGEIHGEFLGDDQH